MGLKVESVSHVYGRGTPLAQVALEDVSLDVEVGELVVVLGPSGSGKTTLMRLAAGLLSPTAGSVLVDGAEASRAARGVVGLAFQRPETQFFAATIEEDVAFGPRNLGSTPAAAVDAARRALEDVGLDPRVFSTRSPFTLSGGEARRAALAGVLAMGPRYLLLDEPTSGLDVAGRRAVCSIVRSTLARAGVVVVTHDAEEFLGEADRVVVLRCGRTIFNGGVEALLVRAGALEDEGTWVPPESVRAQLLADRKSVV